MPKRVTSGDESATDYLVRFFVMRRWVIRTYYPGERPDRARHLLHGEIRKDLYI